MSITKSATRADIFELAHHLPWDERWLLIRDLSETIPQPPPDGMTREAFLAELNRRWEACESGQMKCSPMEEVIERLRRKNQTNG